MQKSSRLSFLYVLLAGSTTLILAYLMGSNGIEMFYIATISLYLLLLWFFVQNLRHLYRMKVRVVLKIFITLALIPLPIVALMIVIGSLPMNMDYTVNGWLILLGIAPFIIPRLGVYRKIKDANKLSVGFLITFLSIILLYTASTAFQQNLDGYRNFLLVLAVQFQFIFTYLALQTNYLEYSRSRVLLCFQRIGVRDENTQSLTLLLTTGLPFILPVIIIFYLALG